MKILQLTVITFLYLFHSSSSEEVRLINLDPPEAQQYIDKQDTSLRYAPKIESNVPAVRFLGNEPHNVLEDIYLANQYHGQDGLGGYLYGYAVPDIAKTEKKKAGGDLRGAYNYIAGNGQEIKVEYWDDGTGFHQIDNVPKVLPQQIDDTPEVKAAKEEHYRIWHEQAERNSKPIASPFDSQGNYAQGPLSPQGQQQRQQQFQQAQQLVSQYQQQKQQFPNPGQNVHYQGDQYGQYQGQGSQNLNRYQPGNQLAGAGGKGGGLSGSGQFGGGQLSGAGGKAGAFSGSGQLGGGQPSAAGSFGGGQPSAAGSFGGRPTSAGSGHFGGGQISAGTGQPGSGQYGGGSQQSSGQYGASGQSGGGQSGSSGLSGSLGASQTGSGQYGAGSQSGGGQYGAGGHSGSGQYGAGGQSGSGQYGAGGQSGSGQFGAGSQAASGQYGVGGQSGSGQYGAGSGHVAGGGQYSGKQEYGGQYSGSQTSSQYSSGQYSGSEDEGKWDEKEEEKGPPKGFFYSFDYPVGIIVQKDGGGSIQKREGDLKDIYASNKANFEKQLQQGHADGSAKSASGYLAVQ